VAAALTLSQTVKGNCMRAGSELLCRLTVIMVVLVLTGGQGARAESAVRGPSGDWILLDGPGGGIVRLWTLPDGTVFAADSQRGMSTSGDEGDTWASVPPPPDGWVVSPDSTDPATSFGMRPDGLYKSTDAGADWQPIRLSASPVTSFDAQHLAISPVDHNLVYLVEPLNASQAVSIVRSHDGGGSWEKAIDISGQPSPCNRSVSILVPHPSDVQRVYSNLGCYAGRNLGTRLSESRDQGSTWMTLFRDGQGLNPTGIVGGAGVDPRRLYLTTAPFMGGDAARLYRSDDGGATWTQVLDSGDAQAPYFGGLAYDPGQPEHAWVATGRTPNPDSTGVRETDDGGATWSFLGRQDIGWVNDLARLPDGTLLAATNEGIWRLQSTSPEACPSVSR
jgi:hypothetical protein